MIHIKKYKNRASTRVKAIERGSIHPSLGVETSISHPRVLSRSTILSSHPIRSHFSGVLMVRRLGLISTTVGLGFEGDWGSVFVGVLSLTIIGDISDEALVVISFVVHLWAE